MVSKKKKQPTPKQKDNSLQNVPSSIENQPEQVSESEQNAKKTEQNISQQINETEQNTKKSPKSIKQQSKIIYFFKENLILFGIFGLICIIACCYLLFAQPEPQTPICNLIKENTTYASFSINGAPYKINTHKPFNIYQINNLTLNEKNVTVYSDCNDALNLKNNPNFANLSIAEIKSAKRIYLITEKNNAAEALIPLFEFGAFCANGEYKYLNATCSIETDTEIIKLANKSASTFVIVYTTLNNTGLDISKENVIAYSSNDLGKLEVFNNYLIYKILGLA